MSENPFLKPVAIIGYSGHGFVVADIFECAQRTVTAYCDEEEKRLNPFNLQYLGKENEAVDKLRAFDFFAAVGNNKIRQKIQTQVSDWLGYPPVNAIHPSAVIAKLAKVGKGIMIAPNVTINAAAEIGNGVICNTSSVIEHECIVGEFVHIAPGAVLCGNVKVGDGSFIGANSVIRQGLTIGKNAVIGAGSVILKDVPDYATVIGNPAK